MIGLGWRKDAKESKIIPVNSIDYEKYKDVMDPLEDLKGQEYVVFLDEYLAFHPDWEILDHITPIPHKKYFDALNNFFSQLEKKLGLEVIIAAHPKSEKYKEHNYFDGRRVFFYKTAQLVKFSKIVLLHNSTTMGLAVLGNRPMLFLNSKLHKRYMLSYYKNIKFYANYFNARELIFDENLMDLNLIDIDYDAERYQKYKYDHLTDVRTEDVRTEDIFIDTIKKIK